jgi:hypothetical protein
MGWINLALRFVRLGPLGRGVIACAILVVGYFLQVEANKATARNAIALRNGPPALVDIAQAGQLPGTSGVDEALIQAQLALDYSYDL